jgi:hypothetical protein
MLTHLYQHTFPDEHLSAPTRASSDDDENLDSDEEFDNDEEGAGDTADHAD